MKSVVRIFVPFALAYFVSYFFRVVNAVISSDLVHEFNLSADDLGLLTGAYFLTFAAAQLPLGLALDRFGSRRTEAALLIVAAVGAIRFATGDTFWDLLVGRALIGLGVSACLMAAFRAYVICFSHARLPLVNGCQMAAGGLGAIVATTPARMTIDVISWQGMFLVMAGITLFSALLIFFAVPEEPKRGTAPSFSALLSGLGGIFASPLFWRVAPLAIASQATFLAIQGLWAGPWLMEVDGLSPSAAGERLMLIAASMIAGFLILGFVAERLGRHGVPTLVVAALAIGAFMLSQLLIITGSGNGSPLPWMMFGFFGTSGILPYAGLSQRFPPHLAGRVNTSLNVLVFVVAFAAQWGIGIVIRLWSGFSAGPAPVGGYQAAFGIMLGLEVTALLWFALFRVPGTDVR
jgi:predicted MFS family arabinose efflux permease